MMTLKLSQPSEQYLESEDFLNEFCLHCPMVEIEDKTVIVDCPCGLDVESEKCVRNKTYDEIKSILAEIDSLWCDNFI